MPKIVQQVSHSIEKMLDGPVTEMSERLYKLVDRIGSLEQRVSDLKEGERTNVPWLDLMESVLKKAMEKLENYELESKDIKIIDQKERIEDKNPVAFFKNWIAEVLNMDKAGRQMKIERAHRMGPPEGSTGGRGPSLHGLCETPQIHR